MFRRFIYMDYLRKFRGSFANRAVRSYFMTTLHYITFGLLTTALWSCNTTNTENNKTMTDNHFPNVIQVQQFGDTVRLEFEKRGDTIIKHYIDLKGLINDNFDGSYNAVCTYNERANDTTITSDFYLTVNGYKFYFDTKKVVAYCDSIMSGLNSDNYNLKRQHYQNLKRCVLHQDIPTSNIIALLPSNEQELFVNFDSKIVDAKTGDKPKSLLIEFYRTEFSGGKYFYIIKNQGDTVGLFHNRDFIN